MRVLIIEDEPRILAFVRRALETEGLTVDGAHDGTEGIEKALATPYDLIVLDLMLPGIGGLQVLEQLRRTNADVPVLILSARSELPTKLRGFELGATDYLTKPFALDELVARVRVQLRRSRDEDPVTGDGRFALDVLHRRVVVDGVATHLSDREFALLYQLLESRGQVVTRERLLSEVWGIDFDPRTNVVDVCVRRLRKKLGPLAPIETVRNAGYLVPQS